MTSRGRLASRHQAAVAANGHASGTRCRDWDHSRYPLSGFGSFPVPVVGIGIIPGTRCRDWDHSRYPLSGLGSFPVTAVRIIEDFTICVNIFGAVA